MSRSSNRSTQPNVRTVAFKQQLSRLGNDVEELTRKAFQLFCENPSHPSLHRKPLADTSKGQHRLGSYSVRVTLYHRAIYVPDGATNVWYWIGTHSDYNTFTGSKRK